MSSFVADKIVMDGLTYDDVLLIPAYSEVLPKQVELKTKFSRNIELERSIRYSSDGHRYRGFYGDCHRPRRWYWCYPQEHDASRSKLVRLLS